jgi:hypothetical protein
LQDFVDTFTTIIKAANLGELGGCTDSTAFNFNPDANFNNGTCIPRIPGCTNEWADNYIAPVGDPQIDVNTDDGSCYATLCTNPAAAGQFGTGYNASLIAQVAEYGEQYETNALIAAGAQLAGSLPTTEDTSVCTFTVIPKLPIIKVVCPDTFEGQLPTPCNSNPIIRVIRDIDTQSISTYTSNPEVVDLNLQSIEDKIITKGNESVDIILEGNNTEPFPSTIDGEIVSNNTSNSLNQRVHSLLRNVTVENRITNFGQYHDDYVINCIENPILSDGSGGCYLFAYGHTNYDIVTRSIGCLSPAIETSTTNDCNNVPLTAEGYLTDFSILSEDYDLQAASPCTQTHIPTYIVGGSNASNFSQTAQANGKYISEGQLPNYNQSQINSEQGGYNSELLIPELIPTSEIAEQRILNRSGLSINNSPNNIFSSPQTMISSLYLFEENGAAYTGAFVIEDTVESNSRNYYKYDTVNNIKSDRLYHTKNTLTGTVTETQQEKRSKKMDKVINKISKLTIFTDN